MDWSRTTQRGLAVLLLASAGLAGPARPDTAEITRLSAQRRELASVRDSLAQARSEVAREAEGLSVRIDRLKGEDSDPGQLHEALRASMVLVQRLVAIDGELETLQGRQEEVLERLRVAYDWEIGVLIQQLSQRPDRQLLARLAAYQEQREALGNEPLASGLRYGQDMTIQPEDGPAEIRQKMELMEDMASRLAAEARKTAVMLQRLEEERRLRTRVRLFAGQMALFDEHVPEGRVLVSTGGGARQQETLGPADAEVARNTDGPLPPADLVGSPGAELLSERRLDRAGGLAVAVGPSSEEVALELRKLRTHQQEILHLEAVVRERVEAFRRYLDKMLEGEE
ncbi:MAG: hypothetical protein AB1505_30860 [Candidatus Latescibacterota bacterium]